jgi:peptide/nickel transport system ATP-binding protein
MNDRQRTMDDGRRTIDEGRKTKDEGRVASSSFVDRPSSVDAPLLRVSNLRTVYTAFGGRRVVRAVDGVSFTLGRGETLGVVGESGSGKTTMCLSVVRLLPRGARIEAGSVELHGRELLRLSSSEMENVRGRHIAMILQDPMASLNPVLSIEDQVAEPAYFHLGQRGGTLRNHVTSLLRAVRIPSPEVRMREYPHQMSGGMRQRVVGAIALSGEPELIIADEPTTNLDVTIQAQYLSMLKDLQRRTGVALLFVTHNLGIVAKMCDKVAVMYGGRIVEQGPVRELFKAPRHPYTQALLRSIPRIGSKEPLYAIPGQPPDLATLPTGCSFHPRCPHAWERCRVDRPEPIQHGAHKVACHLYDANDPTAEAHKILTHPPAEEGVPA